MRGIDIVNKKLWLWLWEEFDVKLSKTICNELHDHHRLTEAGMEKKCKDSIWSFERKSKLKQLEAIFVQDFGIKMHNRENQGECHNCCVALDAVLSGKYRQVIFLTDELRMTDQAREGSLWRVFDNLPIGKIWSSLDFVLYLFARHQKRFQFQIAEDAIRDINARMGGSEKKSNSSPTKRLMNYNNKLKKIDETLSQLQPYNK